MHAQPIDFSPDRSAGAAIPELGSMPGVGKKAQTAAEDAMVTAARVTTLSAAGVILLGLLSTLGLPARGTIRATERRRTADTPTLPVE